MKHLTTPDNIRNDVRPVSSHVDNGRIEIYIKEAELLNIKPRIGDALYIDLIRYVNAKPEELFGFPEEYKKLLEGGNYFDKRCIPGEGSTFIKPPFDKTFGESGNRTFVGLIEVLNYYVYAKLVKNNDFNVARFGFTQKEDEYSSHHELKIKLAAEKDALSVADGYMADCIEYLKNEENIKKFKRAGKAKNRLRISIIGD